MYEQRDVSNQSMYLPSCLPGTFPPTRYPLLLLALLFILKCLLDAHLLHASISVESRAAGRPHKKVPLSQIKWKATVSNSKMQHFPMKWGNLQGIKNVSEYSSMNFRMNKNQCYGVKISRSASGMLTHHDSSDTIYWNDLRFKWEPQNTSNFIWGIFIFWCSRWIPD